MSITAEIFTQLLISENETQGITPKKIEHSKKFLIYALS